MHSVVLVRAGNGAAWTVEVSMVIPRLDRLGPREGINLARQRGQRTMGGVLSSRCCASTVA